MALDRIESPNGERATAGRRIDLARCPQVRVTPLLIDPPTLRLRHDSGKEALLEPRMMQVLVALVDADGATLSRDDLIACCWEGRFVGDEAISSVIYRLRKALKDLVGDAIQIETIARVGFRLRYDHAGSLQSDGRTGLLSRKRLQLGALAAVALAIASFGIIRSGLTHIPLGSQTADPPAIAVLPFDDISPGHQDAYFAQGMAEQIMSQLSVEPDLRVIGKTSAAMIDRNHGIDDARSRLGVTHVLEGSVRRNGQSLRVDVRLVDARNGHQLWSEEFDRTLGDVFAIQDDIGAQVLSRIRGTFTARSPVRAISTTPQVYDLYLAGIALERQATQAAVERERSLLQRAILLDPNYAPAYARLSLLDRPSGMSPEEARATNLRNARRALNLAPELADAQAAMGAALYSDRDWGRSLPYLNKAISLDPGNYVAWIMLAELQFQHLCRPQEAVTSLRRAVAIEPLSPNVYGSLIWDLGELEDFGGAERVIGQYAAVSQNPALVHYWRGMLKYEEGQLAPGLAEYSTAHRLQPGDHWSGLMTGLDILGMRKEALALVPKDQLKFLPPGLSIDDPRSVGWAINLGNDLWASSWGYFVSGSAALVRGGRSDWLVNSFDRNYASVDAFDQALGCKQLPSMAPNLILALRQQGRKRDADRLLQLAMARYAQARKAGYEGGWDGPGAELLVVAGRYDAAFQLLNHALGPRYDRWPWVSLESPVYDPVRNDPRFRAITGRMQTLIAQQRQQFTRQERSAKAA